MNISIRISAITIALAMLCPASVFAEETSDKKGTPELHMVSNAHLDTQWKWTVKQTVDDYLPNTLWQNFYLFEKYPEYVFNFEGAVKYAMIKEYYPEAFEKLKQYVKQGRWRVSGSSWEASDVLVPSSESLFRNILLGQEFFKKEFGTKSCDIMLPDCFGFPYNLPTIANHCGLLGFSTQKLRWRYARFHDGRKWPFEFGIWKGVDGSRILAVAHGYDYNWNPSEDISDNALIKRSIEESPINMAYRYYGSASSAMQADRGGSPTPSAVEWIVRSQKNEKDYKIRMSGSDDVFREWKHLLNEDVLPVHDGELLMDTHGTGCYTAMAAMKRMNRENELAANAAESISVMTELTGVAKYQKWQIENAWKRFLWHQFHDDLTGTSIPEAYYLSWNDELIAGNQFENIIESSLEAVVSGMKTDVKGVPVAVYNPVTSENEDIFTVKLPLDRNIAGYTAYDSKGRKMKTQVLSKDDKEIMLAVASQSKPLSVEIYEFQPQKRMPVFRSSLSTSDRMIENAIWKVSVNEQGDICSIVDKRCGRELVKPGDAFSIDVFENNKSDQWPAWEIYKSTLDSEPVSVSDDVEVEVEEDGPLKSVLKVSRRYRHSRIIQRIVLTDGASDDRIDVVTTVDWKEEGKLMKASFPTSVTAAKATYDIGLGQVMRGNNSNKAYEVYAQQWADISSEDYGITVFTNGKYGWDKPDDNTLRLTLFHSPSAKKNRYVHHRTHDWGVHTFTYSIMGHSGTLNPSEISIDADRMSQQKVAMPVSRHDGWLGRIYSILSSSSSDYRVRCLKKAEDGDGYIVRLYETSGNPQSEGCLTFASDISSAEEVNGLEEYLGKAEFSGNRLSFTSSAYAPKTFRVKFECLRSPFKKNMEAVSLPYDRIAITTDAFPSIGRMDGEWRSYAAEMIPDTLHYRNVPFIFGEADYPNAVTCRGQKLSLPEGTSKVYILAASAESDREAVFVSGEMKYRFGIPSWTGYFGQSTMKDYPAPFVKDADIAYAGNHRHHCTMRNEACESTYMFMYEMPVQGGNLILPMDEDIRILAMTAVR